MLNRFIETTNRLTDMIIALHESLADSLSDNYPSEDRYYPRVKEVIQELEQAIADKQIYNVRWNNAKQLLNAAYYNVKKTFDPDAPSYLHQLAGFARKSKSALPPTVQFWVKVADLLAASKEVVVKGKKPNPNAAPKPDEVIDRNWSPALDLLEQKLNEIIKKSIDEFEKQIREDVENRATGYWEFLQDNNVKDRHDLLRMHVKVASLGFNWPPYPNLSEYMFDYMQNKVEEYPEQKIGAYAQKYASKVAKDSAEHFVSKNKYKMAAFLKNRQIEDINVTSVKVSGGVIHSQMRFVFLDGSEFSVKNQMVYGYSKNGVSFVRYPTTFHDVVIDGKALSGPSELKIYKAFGIEQIPKDKDD